MFIRIIYYESDMNNIKICCFILITAPIILSQPHFYASDPEVINSVIGLHPTPIVHQTILDVEPVK